MDVLELLSGELKDKHWTLEEKVRYVYLRICEIFIFDYRYRLAPLLPNKNEIIEAIGNQKIDLRNLTDRRLVCPTYTESVINVILNELFSLVCNKERSGDHVYPTCLINNQKITLDATIMDLLRVKMKLTTNGYEPVGLSDEDPNALNSYYKHLMEIDKVIGYIEIDYEDTLIKEYAKNFHKCYLTGEYGTPSYTPGDELLKKVLFIEKLYKKYTKVKDNFTDAKFCAGYLIDKIISKKTYRLDTTLFQGSDVREEWDLLHVWRFQIDDTAIYYTVKRIEDEFHFSEEPYSEILKYQNYTGENKGLVLTDPSKTILL